MIWLIIIFGLIIYIIGIILYATGETVTDVKFHDGGFLNLGHTTSSNREMIPSDVRKGFLWPLLLAIEIFKGILYFINDFIKGFLLIFNIQYAETKLYKKIDYWIFK